METFLRAFTLNPYLHKALSGTYAVLRLFEWALACILLEILWSICLVLSISSIFRCRIFHLWILHNVKFVKFVKCVPLGVLAYILLFKDYFKRICAPYGPMKQISWNPLAILPEPHTLTLRLKIIWLHFSILFSSLRHKVILGQQTGARI